MELRPLTSYTVWHPQHGYGDPKHQPNTTRATPEELERFLRNAGLWPLRHGWKVVKLDITPSLVK